MAGAGRGGDMEELDSESEGRGERLQTEAARSRRQQCLLVELAKASQASERVMQYVRTEVIDRTSLGI